MGLWLYPLEEDHSQKVTNKVDRVKVDTYRGIPQCIRQPAVLRSTAGRWARLGPRLDDAAPSRILVGPINDALLLTFEEIAAGTQEADRRIHNCPRGSKWSNFWLGQQPWKEWELED